MRHHGTTSGGTTLKKCGTINSEYYLNMSTNQAQNLREGNGSSLIIGKFVLSPGTIGKKYDKWGRVLRKHIYKPRAKLKGGEWIRFRDWEICAQK